MHTIISSCDTTWDGRIRIFGGAREKSLRKEYNQVLCVGRFNNFFFFWFFSGILSKQKNCESDSFTIQNYQQIWIPLLLQTVS